MPPHVCARYWKFMCQSEKGSFAMNTIRVLGVILGLVFMSIHSYVFLTEHLASLGSVVGFLVGILFIRFGVTGKDSVQSLFKKITGRNFSNGT